MTESTTRGDGRPTHVILGGAGGIGAALARHLAADGANLVLAGRDAARLAAVGESLGAHVVTCDATRFDEVDRVLDEAVERFGAVDGAANCVGSLLLKPAHLTKPDEFADTIARNLTTAFALVRSATRVMQPRGGSIVLLASSAALHGLANHEAIAAAKGGVAALARAAAATYAPRRIRVNAIAPGLVRTTLSARITGTPAAEQASLAMHALGRLGEPEDVAAMAAMLLSPASSWVTGQVIAVDGGLSAVRAR